MHGYYKLINSYQKPFWSGIDQFEKGTDFDNILQLYEFDELFRETILKHCLRFETTLKTVIADCFASCYGSIGCWDRENYNNKCKHFDDFFNTINDLKGKAKHPSSYDKFSNPALCHYMENYGDIPIWVLMGSLTLGTISMMFQCLKYTTQKIIAQKLSKISRHSFNVGDIISSLKLLTLLRNACAHSDPLYNFVSLNTLSETCDAYKGIYENYKVASGISLSTNNSCAAIIILSTMLPISTIKRDLKKLSECFTGLLSKISTQAKSKLIACMHYNMIVLIDIVTK